MVHRVGDGRGPPVTLISPTPWPPIGARGPGWSSRSWPAAVVGFRTRPVQLASYAELGRLDRAFLGGRADRVLRRPHGGVGGKGELDDVLVGEEAARRVQGAGAEGELFGEPARLTRPRRAGWRVSS
ncbi:hypothetical protein [Paractinoplanes abujensis]|uniref:Uncharacterized protein n=1 Tax=Paractinoplanes abujensis TaxID=882441 RepID=A0A7W7CQW4_9ACTN|nr:hypothetical protein [Actinoplanes abujensis]MBB4693076.1 hypothetical protein [Actinoplanes abujensis]